MAFLDGMGLPVRQSKVLLIFIISYFYKKYKIYRGESLI